MGKKKIIIRRILCIFLCLGILGVTAIACMNAYVKSSTSDRILTSEDAAELTDVDCILVLGCGVWDDGTPSHMLEDRLRRGIELHEMGVSKKLLMSGDHGRTNYDEVNVMKAYVVNSGITSEDVFMDHAGFSTYESMYRAKAVFQANKIVIVSQGYHLYRALFIARSMGLDAYGVAADYRSYAGQTMRDFREVLARVKDVGTCILKTQPTHLGEAIPIWGDGNLTNDESSDFS